MTYFHPEEESQFGVLEEYDDKHPGTRYLVEFLGEPGRADTMKASRSTTATGRR